MRKIMQSLGGGNRKMLSRLGMGSEVANLLGQAVPKQPKKVMVDLAKKKSRRDMAKKSKKHNR